MAQVRFNLSGFATKVAFVRFAAHTITAAIAVLFLFAAHTARAVEIERISGRYDGQQYLSMSGEIVTGDLEKVRQAATDLILDGHLLVVHLNSPGGDVQEAVKIGRYLRELLSTTYSYGRNFYTPGTTAGDDMESEGLEYQQLAFHLEPVTTDAEVSAKSTLCLSACVLVFYAGVNRYVSDNLDFRNGYANMKRLPVIGLHRPYFSQEYFAGLSASQANDEYRRLQNVVREYLFEMGASEGLIERMFKMSSDRMDYVGHEEFEQYYESKEPFLDEWLISKCGSVVPENILEGDDLRDFILYWKAAKDDMARFADEAGEFSIPGVSAERYNEISNQLRQRQAGVIQCHETAVRKHQLEWALQER